MPCAIGVRSSSGKRAWICSLANGCEDEIDDSRSSFEEASGPEFALRRTMRTTKAPAAIRRCERVKDSAHCNDTQRQQERQTRVSERKWSMPAVSDSQDVEFSGLPQESDPVVEPQLMNPLEISRSRCMTHGHATLSRALRRIFSMRSRATRSSNRELEQIPSSRLEDQTRLLQLVDTQPPKDQIEARLRQAGETSRNHLNRNNPLDETWEESRPDALPVHPTPLDVLVKDSREKQAASA